MKKILQIAPQFILFITIINFLIPIYNSRDKFLNNDYWARYPSFDKAYWESQYINKNPKGWIPDQTVIAYAGGKLILGTNPVLIGSDAPPLGKYLVGLSIILFKNENLIMVFMGILTLLLGYELGKQIFKTKILASLSLFFFSLEPIFKNQLIYTPLYDLMQLVFLLLSFIFFNKAIFGSKKKFFLLLTYIALGCFISIKFYITGITIFGAFVLTCFVIKDKLKFFEQFLFLPVSIAVLLLSYIRVLSFNSSLHDFLGIQKWVFLYHQSQLILPFSFWPLLFFNKWYVWWGNIPYISDSQWIITWPIITIISIIGIFLGLFRKMHIKNEVIVLMFWVVNYMIFLSLGQTSSRYFVVLIPVLYILAFYVIETIIIKKLKI